MKIVLTLDPLKGSQRPLGFSRPHFENYQSDDCIEKGLNAGGPSCPWPISCQILERLPSPPEAPNALGGGAGNLPQPCSDLGLPSLRTAVWALLPPTFWICSANGRPCGPGVTGDPDFSEPSPQVVDRSHICGQCPSPAGSLSRVPSSARPSGCSVTRALTAAIPGDSAVLIT